MGDGGSSYEARLIETLKGTVLIDWALGFALRPPTVVSTRGVRLSASVTSYPSHGYFQLAAAGQFSTCFLSRGPFSCGPGEIRTPDLTRARGKRAEPPTCANGRSSWSAAGFPSHLRSAIDTCSHRG